LDIPNGPDMVFLYRRPLLDEWSQGGLPLGDLITHVLIHEIGHHFGFSDEDMAAIETEAGL
jgi:predicted Zn-dependent protease with MMP-like domain